MASDKATAPGARHVNNLETVKCKNSQTQALKQSQGFRGECSPRQEPGIGAGLSLPGFPCSPRELTDGPPSPEGLEA